tara:strand:+ start:196 stop:774 length:579 start_codon:yes stop_codon:yes gene_type:complete
MTTFAFINVEASFSGSTTKDHGEQTLYTVPSGKLAKIKFDSYHLSVSSTGNMISDVYWIMYSQNTINNTTLRKHMFGMGDNSGSTIRSFSFYNPVDYKGATTIIGQTAGLYEERTMNAQPYNWVNANEAIDFSASGEMANWTDQASLGASVYGPETFFMGAGEVLKVRTRSVCNGALTRYTNIRCAVWLEDV